MATRNYPADVLEQATDTLAACKQIDPELRAGSLTQAVLSEDVAEAQSVQQQITVLEMQLTGLRDQRDGRLNRIWESVKRMRSTVKGTYGDDSTEYDLVGGTRRSERKRPIRKAKE
jgi:hypothetical protein